jgi:hypothetical protein
VVAVVGRCGELDRPLGRRLLRARDPIDLVADGKNCVHVARRGEPRGKIQRKGAEGQPRHVLVRHEDRAPARPVVLHRADLVVGRLDAPDDREAALAADRVRVGAPPRLGDEARAGEAPGTARGLQELGQLRLPHGEPRQARHRREPGLEVLLDRGAVVLLGEGGMEAAQALEPRLERRLPLAAPRVPGLEVREHRDEPDEGMRGRVVELD